MPLFTQPLLRSKQAAMESEGLIQKRDSTAMTIQKTKESLGQVIKPTLPGIVHVLRGTVHTANNEI